MYLSKREVAKYLNVSEQTVDRLRKDGLPFIMVRGQVRFDREVTDDWFKKNKK